MTGHPGTRRAVWHTSEGGGSSRWLADYVAGKGIEYHLVLDPTKKGLDPVQILPATTGARSLLNGGLDYGGANRAGLTCVQIVLVGYSAHIDALMDRAVGNGLERVLRWLDAWGIPRHHPAHDRRMTATEYLQFSGHLGHRHVAGNDHTDGPRSWGWLTNTTHGRQKPAPHHPGLWVVTVADPRTGHEVPVLHADRGGFTLQKKDAKGHPLGHMQHTTIQDAKQWAAARGLTVKRTLRAKAVDGEHGRLTKNPSTHWPKDPELTDRLRRVADDLGKELRIVSGYRPCGSPSDPVGASTQWGLWKLYQAGRGNLAARPCTSSHGRKGPGQGAADVDVVADGGHLVSIGNVAGAREALKRHGLCLPVPGEPWHVQVGDTWRG